MEEGAPLLGERRVKPKGTSVMRVAALAVSALGTAALIAVVGVSVMSARNPGAAREAVSELGAGETVTETARRALGHERLPRSEFDQPDMLPVIEAGALHALVRNLEAERVDQHQLHIERHTGAPHRAGVAGDLGLDEDDGGHLVPLAGMIALTV